MNESPIATNIPTFSALTRKAKQEVGDGMTYISLKPFELMGRYWYFTFIVLALIVLMKNRMWPFHRRPNAYDKVSEFIEQALD
jgi:hypothetical protein